MFETKKELLDKIKVQRSTINRLKEDLLKVETDLNDTINKLKKEKFSLEERVDKLKLKEKITEEDIKHMIKIKDAEKDLEFRKKEVEANKQRDEEIANIKDSYRDRIEKRLETEKYDMRTMYTEVLARLPNINTRLVVKD